MSEAARSKQSEVRPALRLLMLPGMDGTGELFSDFLKTLPEWIKPDVVRYPANACLSYAELLPMVRSTMPASEPFVVLAESFSTPIAIELAADPPANMQALVICAGFVTSPVGGILRSILAAMAPLMFHLPLPVFVIRRLLLGRSAQQQLVDRARAAVESVSPAVLSRRLREVLACDETGRAARISVPVLYLRPAGDRLVSDEAFHVVRAALRGAAVETIRGPHLILQREPQEAADVIVAFLNRIHRSPATNS